MTARAKTHTIVLSFATLHAAIALLFGLLKIPDGFLLTILTIAMVVYICAIWKTPMHIAVSFSMLACFLGYYLGTLGANLLFDRLGIFGNCLTTFIVTQTIGWIVYFIVKAR